MAKGEAETFGGEWVFGDERWFVFDGDFDEDVIGVYPSRDGPARFGGGGVFGGHVPNPIAL